jgi:hypothetical protein
VILQVVYMHRGLHHRLERDKILEPLHILGSHLVVTHWSQSHLAPLLQRRHQHHHQQDRLSSRPQHSKPRQSLRGGQGHHQEATHP